MADDQTATVDTSADQQQTTTDAEASNQTTQPVAEGAPESYEFKLPEGVTLNEELMGEFSQLAKGANLPQDKAQSLVELGAKMAKGFESAAQKSLADLKESFETDLKNDPTLGGEKLNANLGIAQRAINAYGSEELKKMLSESGLGKHPELVRFFHAVGQTVKEDTITDSGNQTTGQSKSLAERLYGSDAAA